MSRVAQLVPRLKAAVLHLETHDGTQGADKKSKGELEVEALLKGSQRHAKGIGRATVMSFACFEILLSPRDLSEVTRSFNFP